MKIGIKKEKMAAWLDEVLKNSDNLYGFAVMFGAANVMYGLDQKMTPEDSMKQHGVDGLSIFQAGCLADVVSRYSERGEEFRVFWNNKWGVKNSNDIVNPAILVTK